GLGLVYPILLPVGCILVGFTIVLLFNQYRHNPQVWSVLILLIVALIASVAAFLLYVQGVTAARSRAGYQISIFDSFKSHTKYALRALFPAAIVALPFIVRGVL